MSITYQFRPLQSPPAKRTSRTRSRFDSSYSDTLKLLERELSHLAARNVVIQADVDPHQVRNDGLLRSGCTPKSPAIVLSFESKYGDLSYPCDTFTAWQDNLRAIALSLECLRKVDRYGVTRKAEQYQGWAKLPPPSQQLSTTSMTADQADRILGVSSVHGISADDLKAAYKLAVNRHHPDAGGSESMFKKVSEAYELLKKVVG